MKIPKTVNSNPKKIKSLPNELKLIIKTGHGLWAMGLTIYRLLPYSVSVNEPVKEASVDSEGLCGFGLVTVF